MNKALLPLKFHGNIINSFGTVIVAPSENAKQIA
jgi:hypothetical protein